MAETSLKGSPTGMACNHTRMRIRHAPMLYATIRRTWSYIPDVYAVARASHCRGGKPQLCTSCCRSSHWTSRTDRVVARVLDSNWVLVMPLKLDCSTRSLTIIALAQPKPIGIHRSGSFLRLGSSDLRGDCDVRLQRTSLQHGYVC